MVIDTSAIIAVIFDEPECDTFIGLLSLQSFLAISAVTYQEASIVTAGKKRDVAAAALVDDFIADLAVSIAPVDFDMASAAREAYFHFGRGWHPANLNLADCFAYALAKMRNEPLLFKGDDFAQTDIVPAWRP